jgi:sugar O-acyltransferase (sialic acid O-acetyltransferase NeuD family)
MIRLALIGSKDFAIQIRGFAEKTGQFQVIGYFDDFEEKGTLIEGLPVLGKRSDIETLFKDNIFDEIFLAAGYNNFQFRELAFNDLKGKVPFANIIMPDAELNDTTSLGEGIFIGTKNCFGENVRIDDNVFIHGHSFISHDNHIGSHTYISGKFTTAGFVTIGKRNFFGICSIVSDHISTCDDVWIGLGSIVAKKIKRPGRYVSQNILLTKID